MISHILPLASGLKRCNDANRLMLAALDVIFVYLKLLGDLGSVQEEPGAETVHRSEGGCGHKRTALADLQHPVWLSRTKVGVRKLRLCSFQASVTAEMEPTPERIVLSSAHQL